MDDFTLSPCPKCKKEISPQAKACPHCGHPINMYRGYQWRSQGEINGLPLIHIAFGRDKSTGKLLVAKGVVAIGQFAIGLIAIAQFGVGFLFGFGQFLAGYTVIAQFAGGFYFGLGQFATGMTAIGQFAFGKYVLAQLGFGEFVWSVQHKNPQAIRYFETLWLFVRNSLGIN